MSDDIIRKASPASPSVVYTAHAEGDGIAVGHADTFAPTFNLFMAGMNQSKSDISQNYFNLIFGYGYDLFEKDCILVDKKRALTEYIQDDVKAQFGGWTQNSIEKIKKLPAIISNEADGTAEQQAVFAFITDIKVQENGIKVRFQRFFPIPFSLLKENQEELAMHLFEFTRTHWTIKNIDLIEVLQDAGVFPGK